MFNPFRKHTYAKRDPVWVVSTEHGAMSGTVTDVLSDGYIVDIPEMSLKGPSSFWILKRHSNARLRPRTV